MVIGGYGLRDNLTHCVTAASLLPHILNYYVIWLVYSKGEVIGEIIPKVKLVPEAHPRGTMVPSGIISISKFKSNIVSAQGEAEGW